MNTKAAIVMALALSGAFVAGTAEARDGYFRARGANGVVAGGAGPNGGAFVRGRGHYQDSNGTLYLRRGGAVRTPNGGYAGRSSSTVANPDGSLTHRGALHADGPQGTVDSSGSFNRATDGTWTGSQSTTATSKTSGSSFHGSTTIDPATGKPVHSGACYDASGAQIACPWN